MDSDMDIVDSDFSDEEMYLLVLWMGEKTLPGSTEDTVFRYTAAQLASTTFDMSFLQKFFEKWAADEDEQLYEILRRDYWILLYVSMVFPRWKYTVSSTCLLLYYLLMLGVHILLLAFSTYLILIEGNLELLSLMLHYMLLMSYGIYLQIYFNWIRKVVVRLLKRVDSDIGNYRSGRIYSDQWCVHMDKQIRTESYYYMCIPGLIAIMGGVVLGLPYLSKWISGTKHPYSPNGLSMTLPIAVWYPFPTDEGILHYFVAASQLITCGTIAFILVCCQFVFLNFSQKVKYELRVIGYSVDTLLTRSMELTYNTNQEKKDMGWEIEDTEYQRMVELCFKDTIIHHQAIIVEILASYQAAASSPMAVTLLLGLLIIGISLYNILTALKANEFLSLVTFVLLITAETFAMFIPASLGSSLTAESELLRNKLYFMEWYKLDLRNRRLFLNFQTAITEPFVLSAAGIADLNMDTFSRQMNSAYSFFNLMNVKPLG